MGYRGPDFYDNEENFEKYMERRQWQENANDTLEKPVMLEADRRRCGQEHTGSWLRGCEVWRRIAEWGARRCDVYGD